VADVIIEQAANMLDNGIAGVPRLGKPGVATRSQGDCIRAIDACHPQSIQRLGNNVRIAGIVIRKREAPGSGGFADPGDPSR
jgi:hypothetical protein